MVSRGKKNERLAKTDILTAGVQVVASGGETNLHAHSATDAFWLVLDGKATFYGEGDRVVARLERHDALVIPRGTPYWFESSGETPLVIVRVGANAQDVENKRVDYSERRAKPREVVPDRYFES
jgi:mannose-6-phosphate isomerase-like protein (cupin superfamily)